MKLFKYGKDGAAGSCNTAVLKGDCLHICHDPFCFYHLFGDLSSFFLESLECLNDMVVIQNISTGFIKSLEQLPLQPA